MEWAVVNSFFSAGSRLFGLSHRKQSRNFNEFSARKLNVYVFVTPKWEIHYWLLKKGSNYCPFSLGCWYVVLPLMFEAMNFFTIN